MKLLYKVALIVSVVVFVLAVLVFRNNDQPQPTQAADAQANEPAAPEPRKTLRDGSKGGGSLESMLKAQTSASTGDTAGTLAADARSRVMAANAPSTPGDGDNADSEPDAGPDATPSGKGSSGVLSLARTASGSNTPTPKPTPAPVVSRRDLESVFASADRSDVPRPDKPSNAKAPAGTASLTTPPPDGADTPGTYTVKAGETYSSIAIDLYDDESRWADIAQANPLIDPTRLRVGQVLRLPDNRHILSEEEPVPPGPGGIQTYTIRPGDNLSTVAQTFYGDPTLWRTIYNFNRDKIGENPNAIQAGMTLKVPPSVRGAR
jgi:nucleoid-associated protein YgaU